MTGSSFNDALWAFRQRMPKAARLYVAGCSGEPLALAAFLRENPEWADGVTFLGIWIPGVNQTDWASFHPNAKAESIFLSADKMASFSKHDLAFRPLSYTQSVTWLQSTPLDGAIIVTDAPTPDSSLSLGVSADFSGTVLERPDVPALALANVHMPRPMVSIAVNRERFETVIADEAQLLQIPHTDLPSVFRGIGQNVASLIVDGDTLQFGLGNVQQAVLSNLHQHRDLRIHSGMVSDPVLTLLEKGSIASGTGSITCGVALGTDDLYATSAADDRFSFQPVAVTHSIETLSKIRNFKAINSAISVDLFGQVNAEFLGTKQVSGTGGLVDFLRGASVSKGGYGMIALASTAHGGSISRIVPTLGPGATSVARQDVGFVVTEFGTADLRHQTIDERAERLIGIAHPDHRASLANEWDAMRSSMA